VLTGPSEVGTGKAKDEDVSPLSAVITIVNEKFGTDFDEGDRLFMEQVVTDLAKDEALAEQARTNSLDNFRHAFDPADMNAVLGQMERNEAMSNADFRGMLLDATMREFASRARGGQQPPEGRAE
jgi:type I restriction enzyme R subunit